MVNATKRPTLEKHKKQNVPDPPQQILTVEHDGVNRYHALVMDVDLGVYITRIEAANACKGALILTRFICRRYDQENPAHAEHDCMEFVKLSSKRLKGL